MNSQLPFSVLMPVHAKERRDFLHRALRSIAEQTVQPDEVVIVEHGELPESLRAEIRSFGQVLNIQRLSVDGRSGVGTVMQQGILRCQHSLVARMDSDDISEAERFELQLEHMSTHPEVDVLGGWTAEFENTEEEIIFYRRLPLEHCTLRKFASRRNPMNHVTVMIRREAVAGAGGYQDFRGVVDYWLWARMMMQGSRFANIPRVLVNVRIGQEFWNRRSGIWYFKTELQLQHSFLRMGFINRTELIRNIFLRGGIRLLPNKMLRFAYGRWARESAKLETHRTALRSGP